MRIKFFITTVSFLVSALYTLAQIPSPLIFSRVTKKEGLASNTAFQSVRDKQGFLWIATQNGLQRYDANRFLTFRHIPGDASSIPDNTVNRLFIDSKERLWVFFGKQVGIFNTSHFTFSETKLAEPVRVIKKIMEDDHGSLILFADNKQLLYDEIQHAFNAAYPLPALPADYTLGDMAIDPVTGMYWFTGKRGSFLYNYKTKQFNTKELNPGNNKIMDSLGPVKNARYPFIAKDGTYWMVNWLPFSATAPILYSYDKNKNEVQRFEKIRPYKTTGTYYEIWKIFEQSNGTIWVCGMGLLAYYNKAEKRFINIDSDPFKQYGIDYDFVSDLYEDKEKNVWVCTNNGLYRFNVDAQFFHNIPNKRLNDSIAAPNVVSSIIQTKKYGTWVSTWGAGVFSYNDQWQPIPNPVTTADTRNKFLHASIMMQRRNGEIWIGTNTGEIKVYDEVTGSYSSVLPSLLQGQIISQLLEDYKGNTWIATASGTLVKCEKTNWKDTASAYKSMLSDADDILKLYEDNNHHLWICTATTGLYEMDIETGKILNHYKTNTGKSDGLLNDGATDIVQYNDSIYLIASDELCILNKRANTFRYLTSADGLPAEHITSFIIDKRKRLWIALDGGLYRLNIDNNLHVTYDVTDGITNNVFQVASSTVFQDGRIAIGTSHDFVVFDPEQTIDRTDAPAVHITGFSLGTTTLSVDSILQSGKVILSNDNTSLRIELSTLHFRDQYSIHYMLEGLDKTWKEAYNNEIIYQYLPPGNYTLKLRSENGETMEIKNITTLEIEVKPPFWQTWWFYSLMALMIGGLLFWLDHQRIKRKTAMLEMRSDIADELHQDINAALSNITILSKMAKMKADKEPEKSKEFIDDIHTKSQNMTTAMDDILWSIDPDNDSMESFILRFREYVDTLKTRENVQIDVLVDKKTEQLPLKMKMRNDVFWLFKGGITNVVKTGARNCRIHITYEKPNLMYMLEFGMDTVDTKQLDNLRLRNELSSKLQELGATLDFKVYTTNALFVLKIPARNR